MNALSLSARNTLFRLEALQKDEISAVDVLDAFAWMALEAHSKTNCLIEFVMEAFDEAQRLDEEWRGKPNKPPLFGLPFSVKGNLFVSISYSYLTWIEFRHPVTWASSFPDTNCSLNHEWNEGSLLYYARVWHNLKNICPIKTNLVFRFFMFVQFSISVLWNCCSTISVFLCMIFLYFFCTFVLEKLTAMCFSDAFDMRDQHDYFFMLRHE